MRQLLATIVLGGALAVTASAAFAANNRADKDVPAFPPITLQAIGAEVGLSGANTQQTWLSQYRSENIGQ